MCKVVTKLVSTVVLLVTLASIAAAQDAFVRRLPLGEAKEVTANINGTIGTIYLKRGSGSELIVIRERSGQSNQETADISVQYHEDGSMGDLTVELGNGSENGRNALGALFRGNSAPTWYITISDKVPIHFDITLGAGSASLDLSGIHVRAFRLDAGAGSVRMKVNEPNREEIQTVSLSAGVGKLHTRRLGNLRFHALDFQGGIGKYLLDCSGELPNDASISTDLGVGSLTVVLPQGTGAKAHTENNWLSSRKMNGFIRQQGSVYLSENYAQSQQRVELNMQSGVGSVAIRWAK
jgi:hypothetical protein